MDDFKLSIRCGGQCCMTAFRRQRKVPAFARKIPRYTKSGPDANQCEWLRGIGIVPILTERARVPVFEIRQA